MNTSTLSELAREAPAVLPPRRAVGPEKLIDTSKFLSFVKERYNAEPFFTIQGSRHEDAETSARDGRHLVAAEGGGLTFVLLNSHYKDRRAHVGVGLRREASILIGPSTPVQRWKGFEEPLLGLCTAENIANLNTVSATLGRAKVSPEIALGLARAMSRHGYLANVEARPSAKGLLEGLPANPSYLDLGFTMLSNMQRGNIESSKKGGRRVKRVQRPDGLFHAGMIAFGLILTEAQNKRRLSAKIGFGDIADRAVRP